MRPNTLAAWLHAAQRPAWTCRQGCPSPWPCRPARCQLHAAFHHDPWGLPELALKLMAQASEELRVPDRATGLPRRLPWEQLYRRFVAWTWPAGTPPSTVTIRLALNWVVNPGNRRMAPLVQVYGPLGALDRMLRANQREAS